MSVTEQEESKLVQKMNGNYKQEAERLGKELSTLTMQRAKGAMEFTVSKSLTITYILVLIFPRPLSTAI